MFCVIAVFMFGASRPADAVGAGDTTIYDAVDAIEVQSDRIKVTGIISGQSDPSTTMYQIASSSPGDTGGGSTDVAASRCDRLALLAMSRPGKFQFATVVLFTIPLRYSCKLIVRAP